MTLHTCRGLTASPLLLIPILSVACPARAADDRGLPACPDIVNDVSSCHIAGSLAAQGAGSSATPGLLRTMDNFTPAAASPTRLCWLGHYQDRTVPAALDESFSIRIFADDAGMPDLAAGTIFQRIFRQSGTPGVDLLEMDCLDGQSCPGTPSDLHRGNYTYSIDVDGGLPLAAGGCYWIEIACQGSAAAGLGWFWSASLAGNDAVSLQATDGNYTVFTRISSDRALCISGGVNPLPGNCTIRPLPPVCSEFDPAFGQPHDGQTQAYQLSSSPGSPSDGNFVPVQWAENFRLSADAAVSSLCFRGVWWCATACQTPASPDFDITYFADNGGLPGDVLATFRTGMPGVSVIWDGGEAASVQHPPVPLLASTCYWLSISRQQGYAPAYLSWGWARTTTPQGDGVVAANIDGQWRRRILTQAGSAATSNFSFILNAGPLAEDACPPRDCNNNGIPDAEEIAANPALDCFNRPADPYLSNGADAILDSCQCRADFNRDNAVNSLDISTYISVWLYDILGHNIPADVNCDGVTNSVDIAVFIQRWLDSVTGQTPLDGCP